MVKPASLEHCLFVWISLRRSAAEKYIPLLPLAGLLPALKCLASLEPQGKSAGEGDSALCPPEVLGIRHAAVPARIALRGAAAAWRRCPMLGVSGSQGAALARPPVFSQDDQS